MHALKPLAVTMGDPAGCGPDIIVQAWKKRKELNLSCFYVIGLPEIYAGRVETRLIERPDEAPELFAEALPVLPLPSQDLPPVVTGTGNPHYAAAIIQSIDWATRHALKGEASAIVTNPISKAILYQAGFAYPGHTEFIAELCRTEQPEQTRPPVMMLVGGGLRVALMTIHIPLIQVSTHLSRDLIRQTCMTVFDALQTQFRISTPRLALCGLNPHAGEEGTIGLEEVEYINPVAAELRQAGLDISDARPADTVFHEALSGTYDAVIAMTHDQGLIPVKTLDFWGGVNTTLGLPILRTSPDHGTAYDAARAGQCRPDSLISALRLAADMARDRQSAYD